MVADDERDAEEDESTGERNREVEQRRLTVVPHANLEQ